MRIGELSEKSGEMSWLRLGERWSQGLILLERVTRGSGKYLESTYVGGEEVRVSECC